MADVRIQIEQFTQEVAHLQNKLDVIMELLQQNIGKPIDNKLINTIKNYDKNSSR